jgi:hypothetical protein
MTMSKLSLFVLALPLCFAAACATTPDAITDPDGTATDTAVLTRTGTGSAQTDGASCTVVLPFSWRGADGSSCSMGGHTSITILDGLSHTFTSLAPNTGSCTYRCIDGTFMVDCCTCTPGSSSS